MQSCINPSIALSSDPCCFLIHFKEHCRHSTSSLVDTPLCTLCYEFHMFIIGRKYFLIPQTKHWLESESLVLNREKIKAILGELLVLFCRPDMYKLGLTLDAETTAPVKQPLSWPQSFHFRNEEKKGLGVGGLELVP